ncbi:MAG: ribosome silencing factor [Candidatus Omnitrophota bacterium]|nr:ribosome silencing factor [Candidatus Omnitrophota bacterium]
MSNSKKKAGSKDKIFKIVDWAVSKGAINPIILDVSASSGLCDYFIICSADNSRQVEAICDEIKDKCKKEKIRVAHIEKDDAPQWILMDMVDVIFHIFIEEARDLYNLECLWSDAKKIKIPPAKKVKE